MSEGLITVKFKPDVGYDVDGAFKIMMTAQKIYEDMGKTLVVTEYSGGTHMKGSKHYIGNALDLRTNYFSKADAEDVAWKLQVELGSDYDVVLESTHIHAEYDPK